MNDSRASNRAISDVEFAARRIVLSSKPTVLTVELTQNCNAACKMCRSRRPFDPALNMSDDLFSLLAETLFPYASVVDLRGQGESTILAGFPDKLRVTLDSGVKVRLVTNGQAVRPELWEMLFEGDSVVAVSLDTVDPNTYADLGRGDFNVAARNLQDGVRIQRQARRGTVYLNVVVTAATLEGLPWIVRFAAAIGLTKVVVNPIKCQPSNPLNLKGAARHLPRVLDEALEVARKSQVILQLGASLDESLVVGYGLPSVCANPWTNALVDYAGRVGFCHHTIGCPELLFGSIRETGFEAIWNGIAFQSLRHFHATAERARRFPPRLAKCAWCYQQRYLDSEPPPVSGMDTREVSSRTGLPIYQFREAIQPQ